MSYCRWSSDFYRCDLYCYESAEGFVTHVASSRYNVEVPADWDHLLEDPDAPFNVELWMARHAEMSHRLKDATLVPLHLPHDGESYCDSSLEDFLARVQMPQAAGYRVPPYVVPAIQEEIDA